MITANTFPEIKAIANRISKKELRSISIWQRFDFKNQKYCDDFMVFTEPDEQKHLDKFIMLITNFDSPFEVYSKSPKSGEHWEYFPTAELVDKRYSELIKEKYRTDIRRKYCNAVPTKSV